MTREYIAVVWPTGYEYRDEIRSRYEENTRVKSVSTFFESDMVTPHRFKEFIFEIYKNDDLSREILEYKTGLMMKNEHFICSSFTFAIESVVDENAVDESVLAIKTDARNMIAAKMADYYYDVLFHVSDVKSEAEYIKTVLKKFNMT